MNNDQLTGIIEKFIFQNQETGFTVLVVAAKKHAATTVTGTFADIQIGQEIHLEGQWSFHSKFGKQFQASQYTTTLPSSVNGIKKYLGSGFIKGIGKVYAETIVNYFGENTLKIIDSEPDRLKEIEGIGKKRLEVIKKSWTDQKYIAKIMVFLQEKGVTSTYATKIYKKYGHEAIALLTQNPYRLTDDIWGIGFKSADQIAQNMGFATGSLERIQAGIIFTLKQASGKGHVYQEVEDLKNKAFQLLELDPKLHQKSMKHALTNLYHQDKIKLLTHKNKHFVGISSLYGSEKALAEKLQAMLKTPSPLKYDMQELYKELQTSMHIALNEDQQKGILSCFEQKISIITGGPGTGKTTLVKSLLHMFDSKEVSYKLAAPTGRAAKRLQEGTGKFASTIHRLLEFDPTTMRFQKHEQNALKTDVLIIDEASMIDIFLGHAIVKALSLNTHLILIGDVDQLPSIGPGNVLKDLIQSGIISTTKLTHIFRQAQDSMIVMNAHNVNRGELPIQKISQGKKDFYFFKEEKPEDTFHHIERLLKTVIPQHKLTTHDVTILTPMNRGAVGTQKLNHDLQELLNKATTKHASYGGTLYKIKDRVMQIRNNYDKNVFNGDIGTINHIDPEEKLLTVNFDGTDVQYAFDELSELVLAYAITIHKSQGSEYDAVIIPIFMQHFMLLQKNLIYTAITRAKKLCIIIGQTKALAVGIKNNTHEERITFLDIFLTEQLSCR